MANCNTNSTPNAPPNSTCQPVSVDCGAQPNLSFGLDNGTAAYQSPQISQGTLDYSTSTCADNDSAYMANLMAQALNIAAGPCNIFPLLGVHSQGSTIDMVNATGYPLSSGTPTGFNALNAFNVNSSSWRSVQQGIDVITKPAYLGYCFGTKKAWDKVGAPQERYQAPEPVRRQVGSIKLQQGDSRDNRASQARIEASDDGLTWHRVDVVKIPDTNELVTIGVRSNAMYNQWRIIPTFFNGVATNSQWEVQRLQLMEATATAIDNIQDFFLMENRDRSYCRTSVMIKAHYDLLDVQTELAKFGINIPQTYVFTCSFATLVQTLGRPLVVGDIVELPGEVQYNTSLQPVRKWLEVTDTAWSTDGYTPNWKPQLYKFYAQPIMPSVEHRDILGLPGVGNYAKTDDDFLAGMMMGNDQAYKASEAIKQISKDNVPQSGADGADIQSGMPALGPAGGYDGNDMYLGDAIPPNGQSYTIGDTLPLPADILNGHYHRQTYTMIPESIRPPERLLIFSATTQRWSVVEINNKTNYESHKRTISRIMGSSQKVNPDQKI
jgi:hypothetical protein